MQLNPEGCTDLCHVEETLSLRIAPMESGLAGGLRLAVVGVAESAELVPCNAGSFPQVGQSRKPTINESQTFKPNKHTKITGNF